MLTSPDNNSQRWTASEWQQFVAKLECLSVHQLRQLATDVGIEFKGGVESIQDRDVASAKEQLILVLDEVPKDELLNAYTKIVRPKNSQN